MTSTPPRASEPSARTVQRSRCPLCPRRPQYAIRLPCGDQRGPCALPSVVTSRLVPVRTSIALSRPPGRQVRRVDEGVGGDHDLLAVGRPAGRVAEVRQAPHRLAGRVHHEDAAALPLRAEGDVLAVGRKRGLAVVDAGVRRQVHGVAAAHPAQVDVVGPARGADVDEALAVGRQARTALDARLVGERDVRDRLRAGRRERAGARRTAPGGEQQRGGRERCGPAQGAAATTERADAAGRRAPLTLPESACRSKARSRADWKRSSGRFSRQCRTIWSSAGETLDASRTELGRLLLQDRRHGLGGGLALERSAPGEHLVEHHAEREDVGAVVGDSAAGLLGRHVPDRAHHRSGVGVPQQRRRVASGRRSRTAGVDGAPGRSRAPSRCRPA